MRVTVLGCGSSAGIPLIGGADGTGDWGVCDPAEPRNRRTRTSIVIESDQTEGQGPQRLLVDTSPDLRTQLLSCAIGQVHAVLYTHAHADHVAGIDDVRALNRAIGTPLDAYADEPTLGILTARYGYVFQPWKPPGFFRPVLTPRQVSPGDRLSVAGLDLHLFDQDHGFVHSLGLRCGAFGYSTDVMALDDAAFAALAGIDTWLVGCFQRASHTTHAALDQVIAWSARVAARRTILTHMGPDLDWAWMQANLPPGIEPAHDGMVIDLPA